MNTEENSSFEGSLDDTRVSFRGKSMELGLFKMFRGQGMAADPGKAGWVM